jgi:hypothetical protein
MDAQHLNTYLSFVEALLQCAKGEEWLLLQQHENLINAELLTVMEQVSNQLSAEGNVAAAKFLHYWVVQLTLLQQQSAKNPEPPPPPPANRATSSLQLTSPKSTTHHDTNELLEQIFARLEKLEVLLNQHLATTNPLWYMSILEEVNEHGWIISSEEVERLIGIKPTCIPGHNFFVRGCWKFMKTGKIGGQSSWQVIKEITTLPVEAPSTPTDNNKNSSSPELVSPWSENS